MHDCILLEKDEITKIHVKAMTAKYEQIQQHVKDKSVLE